MGRWLDRWLDFDLSKKLEKITESRYVNKKVNKNGRPKKQFKNEDQDFGSVDQEPRIRDSTT
jgi:hypothetical protein